MLTIDNGTKFTSSRRLRTLGLFAYGIEIKLDPENNYFFVDFAINVS